MKKLEKEQLPKVIALGVMSAGLLGYAAYTCMGGRGGAARAVAATPHTAPTAAATPTADAQPSNPALQLAAIDHQDPFKPAINFETGPTKTPPAAAKPAEQPAPPQTGAKPPLTPLKDTFDGPVMEGPAGTPPRLATAAEVLRQDDPAKPPSAPAPVKAAPPAPPSPPAIVVTGILEGDDNVAIVKWSDEHRQVVRLGDRLDGGFVVKAIRPDAVVLARGSFQWTARLGAAKPAAN
jgi:hypothetical protein